MKCRGKPALCRFAAILACLALVLGGLAAPITVKSADTDNDWFTAIPNYPPGVTMDAVAWNSAGTYACFVGSNGVNARMFWYDPTLSGAAAWTEALVGGSVPLSANGLHSVAWDEAHGWFIAMTDGVDAFGYWYTSPTPTTVTQRSDADLVNLNCTNVVYDQYNLAPNARFYAVGFSLVHGAACYELNLNTLNWALLTTTDNGDDQWNSVAVDPAPPHNLLLVGEYVPAAQAHYYKYFRSNTTLLNMMPYGNVWLYLTDIVYVPTTGEMLLTSRVSGGGTVSCIYRLTGPDWQFSYANYVGKMPPTTQLYDIDVDDDGRAIAVGWDADGSVCGRVYDIWRVSGSWLVMQRSNATSPFTSEQFTGIAIRPTGVQMAMVSGSAFRYSYTSVLGPIQVDTAVPHINYIDLYPAGSPGDNKLNSQIDVDIGDGGTVYTLEVGVYDSLGVGHMTDVEVWMWYDQGNTSVDFTTNVTPAFDTPGWENTRMHFRITRAGPTITQIYPAQGPADETRFGNGWWSDINATFSRVTFDFSPHQQVRWAAGPFTPGFPGNARYDPDFDGPETQEQSTPSALNDDLTWDIKATVADDATVANHASAYDEYGFYRYTYLGTSGIPNGGAVYGSGAPGTSNVVMSVSGANVTYSANCPYGLTIQLMGNLNGVAYAGTIPATAISLQGGGIGAPTAFGAGGSTQQLIGPLHAPLNSYRTTTTSSWDGNSATWEPVRWWVNIPSVLEDQYVNQVTWAITN